MMLFERMMQNPEEGARIAAEFAEYQRNDQDSDRKQKRNGSKANQGQISNELAAILNRRQYLLATLEQLAEEHSQWQSAFEDFAGIGEQSQRQSTFEEQAAQINAEKNRENSEYVNTTKEIKAEIRMLNRFACQLCSALYLEGITLTGGQISRLTRLGMSKSVRVRLDLLKKDKIAVLPQEERLTEQDASAMFDGLAQKGLITGEKSDFIDYFGQGHTEAAKRLKRALSWRGTMAQLAYLIARYSQIALMQTGEKGTPIYREKAFCRAFGIDERTQANVLRPYLSDFHANYRSTCKGSAEIASVFNVLPCLNTNAEANQYFAPKPKF
jgi:hypothetical protein